jgi:hypothetical protein
VAVKNSTPHLEIESPDAINALDGSLASPMLKLFSFEPFTERAKLLGGFAMAIPTRAAHTDGFPRLSHNPAIWRILETACFSHHGTSVELAVVQFPGLRLGAMLRRSG